MHIREGKPRLNARISFSDMDFCQCRTVSEKVPVRQASRTGTFFRHDSSFRFYFQLYFSLFGQW